MLANIILLAIITIFWAPVLARARRTGRKASLNLLLGPLVFAVGGYALNKFHPWWGTYVVGAIHVFFSIVLLRRKT